MTKLDPKYAKAWSNKGVALKVLGRTSEADAAFPRKKNWRTVDRVQFGAYLLDRGFQIFAVLNRRLRSLMQDT